MSDRNATIQHDLGRHMQRSIGELIQRQVTAAGNLISPADVAIMLIEVAVSTSLTAAASVAATVTDDAKIGEFFDHTLSSIGKLAAADRERSLAAIIARRAAAE